MEAEPEGIKSVVQSHQRGEDQPDTLPHSGRRSAGKDGSGPVQGRKAKGDLHCPWIPFLQGSAVGELAVLLQCGADPGASYGYPDHDQ